MRVIGGTARGRRLAGLEGNLTRPTADRVREALFSILFSILGPLNDKKVLDLYSGSGALAIEALSRGAGHAWLVEKAPPALAVLEKNLQLCRFTDRATILRQDVRRAGDRLEIEAPFDLIFADPPYGVGLAEEALELIADHALLASEGVACFETDSGYQLPDRSGDLVCRERRRYGSATMLHVYTRNREETS